MKWFVMRFIIALDKDTYCLGIYAPFSMVADEKYNATNWNDELERIGKRLRLANTGMVSRL